MNADDVPVGGTITVGALIWRRYSLNRFAAEGLGRSRLAVSRPMRWKKMQMDRPWRIEVFGDLLHPARFRNPVAAMGWAAKVALQQARHVVLTLDPGGLAPPPGRRT